MSVNSLKGHGASSESVRGRAIVALLSERTLGRAARRCGVSERTLRRWMSDDEDFVKQLADARCATFVDGMQRVQALTSAAIDTLAALSDNHASTLARTQTGRVDCRSARLARPSYRYCFTTIQLLIRRAGRRADARPRRLSRRDAWPSTADRSGCYVQYSTDECRRVG